MSKHAHHANELFADVFDDAEAPNDAAASTALPAVAELSQVELASAAAAGYQRGRTDEAGDRSALVASAISTIAERLIDASTCAARVADDSAAALLSLLLDVVCTGFPSLRVRFGEQEVLILLRAVLPALARDAAVAVQVNPLQLDAVIAELKRLPLEHLQSVAVTASEAIEPGDATVIWPDGRAIRNSGEAWKAIQAVLGPLGLLASQDIVPVTPEVKTAHAR